MTPFCVGKGGKPNRDSFKIFSGSCSCSLLLLLVVVVVGGIKHHMLLTMTFSKTYCSWWFLASICLRTEVSLNRRFLLL